MMCIGPAASLIEYKELRYVVSYMPDVIATRSYIQDLQQYNTQTLVTTCECVYPIEIFHAVGITVKKLVYPDGTFPVAEIIDQWLEIVKNHNKTYPQAALAIHCRSGLGRSPALVAVALMEQGMKPQDAIEFIRSKRRDAFNEAQVQAIIKYQTKNRLMVKSVKIITKPEKPKTVDVASEHPQFF